MAQVGQKSTGIVKSWRQEQGYGFITPDGENNDLFFHYSAKVDQSWMPTENDRVSFEVIEGKKGLAAGTVALVGAESNTDSATAEASVDAGEEEEMEMPMAA